MNRQPADSQSLADNGLNLRAVFDVESLPDRMQAMLRAQQPELHRFRQLHLFGHGGRRMWQTLQASAWSDKRDPVDRFSADLVCRYFETELHCSDYRLLFPGGKSVVPLQQLGELAGWHHPSPFRVGVNREWGSWFAYRAVVLADTQLAPTPEQAWGSPCDDCARKPCIAACPAAAMEGGALQLERCIDYRRQDASPCAAQCLSRLACPVAQQHRYSEEQIGYHYGRSLQTILAYQRPDKR